jgi:RNA polymerase sigma-70 factor (ECF subfamily)
MSEKTDEMIASEVQEGDVSSFGVLMERYEEKLARYGRKFLADSDDIKDLVQEVFIKAYMNMQSFDTARKFSPWIYRIAHNEFVNAIKKKKSRITFSLSAFDTLLPHPAAKEDIESDAQRRELRGMLEKSLQSLDPKYREPLVLYYFEDLDYKEIGEILKMPVSTVGIRLQRGKGMLKKLVENNEGVMDKEGGIRAIL